MEPLTDSNFLIFAAKAYYNPKCFDTKEFMQDIGRIKSIKKILIRFGKTEELRERLLLNHIIVLQNLFGVTATTKMLFLKLGGFESQLKPLLVYLNILPEVIEGINNQNIVTSDIPMDPLVIQKLRCLKSNHSENS